MTGATLDVSPCYYFIKYPWTTNTLFWENAGIQYDTKDPCS